MSKRKAETPTINFPIDKWSIGDVAYHVVNRSNYNLRKRYTNAYSTFHKCKIVLPKAMGAIVEFENGIRKFCEYQLLTREVPLTPELPETSQ